MSNYNDRNNPTPIKEETEAEARAFATAYNKNWNILLGPHESNSPNSYASAENAEGSNSNENILSRFLPNNDNEDTAVAKAEGKAIIHNTNVNVYVEL